MTGARVELVKPVALFAALLIDVINDSAFEGSAALVERAEPMASRLAALERRASAANVPAIYINNNFGRCDPTSSRDEICLKPKHSGFFDIGVDT